MASFASPASKRKSVKRTEASVFSSKNLKRRDGKRCAARSTEADWISWEVLKSSCTRGGSKSASRRFREFVRAVIWRVKILLSKDTPPAIRSEAAKIIIPPNIKIPTPPRRGAVSRTGKVFEIKEGSAIIFYSCNSRRAAPRAVAKVGPSSAREGYRKAGEVRRPKGWASLASAPNLF